MSSLAESPKRALSLLAGLLNRIRLGLPSYFFHGAGGIGDDLICTTVFRELRKRSEKGIVFATQYPCLFKGNSDLDAVIDNTHPRLGRLLREGLPFMRLGYAHYDEGTDQDEPLRDHLLAKICRVAGLTGQVDLRPYVHLGAEEQAAGRLADNQVVIQSSALAAAHSMKNKEWYAERFQEVCAALCDEYTVIQIGSINDPRLVGAVDLRGRTTLRQSASILANSLAFIGLVGFLMHLARAVDCRSTIIYGGRELPSQTGYLANINLTGPTSCSPCWLRNRCDYRRECMNMISSDVVVAATRAQVTQYGRPLDLETASL